MSGPLTTFPSEGALPPYYHGYLSHVERETDILAALDGHAEEMVRLLRGLTREQEIHRYAEGKWSVREVLGHLIDTERVFQVRALWFARGDGQPLPGYDENVWGANTNAGDLPMAALVEEYRVVRRSTLHLFRNMDDELLSRTGEANGRAFQVGALAWFLLAHERHHRSVLHERYGL